jgi:hypothetical protein
MSNRATECVRWLSRSKGCAFDVLLAIADYADAEGRAYPATETLARVTHWHLYSVRRALAELRQHHADEFEQTQQGNGRHHANRYRIKLVDRYVEAVAEKKRWAERHRSLDLESENSSAALLLRSQTVAQSHPFGCDNSGGNSNPAFRNSSPRLPHPPSDPPLRERSATNAAPYSLDREAEKNATPPAGEKRASPVKNAAKVIPHRRKHTSDKHAVTWPVDFTLTEERRQVAIRHGRNPEGEWERFHARAMRDGSTYVDWDGGWVYWCSNDIRRNGGNANGAAAGNSGPPRLQPFKDPIDFEISDEEREANLARLNAKRVRKI